MEEEGISFSVSGDVFYNPAMRLCRSMSSLAVGAIGEKLEIVDAFCASGIRGIRYAKENKVKSLTFVDIEPEAMKLAKRNAKANKLKAEFRAGNISRVALDMVSDFVEIDPFGTPSPYLVDSLRFFNPKKTAYLSVTATDVAVLCGGKIGPCLKNYHAKPLNNEFTHETGLRIMLKRISDVAAEFNMGIEPLVSFSDKHYLKSVLRLRRSAELAVKSQMRQGYVSFDKETGFRTSGEFPEKGMEFAGPLWLGELHDLKFIKKMGKLNQSRDYADQQEISSMLGLMENEVGMPPYYYNVHAICKIKRLGYIPPMGEIIGKIQGKGYKAGRTHFSKVSIKTDAPYEEVLEAV